MTEVSPDEKSLKRAREENRVQMLIGRIFKKTGLWPTINQIKKATGCNQTRWSSEDVQRVLLTLQGEGVVEQFIYEDKRKRGVRFKLTI